MEKVKSLAGFKSKLAGPLVITGTTLPLSLADTTKIVDMLGTEYYSYLTISSSAGYYEVVLVVAEAGSVVIDRRAVLGVAPQVHPNGSCVEFDINEPFIVDLICQTNCCEPDPDCPCVPLTITAPTIVEVEVGQIASFNIVADGDGPIHLTADAPSWLTLDSTQRSLSYSGQALEAGVTTVSYAGTNCNGVNLVTGALTINVVEP